MPDRCLGHDGCNHACGGRRTRRLHTEARSESQNWLGIPMYRIPSNNSPGNCPHNQNSKTVIFSRTFIGFFLRHCLAVPGSTPRDAGPVWPGYTVLACHIAHCYLACSACVDLLNRLHVLAASAIFVATFNEGLDASETPESFDVEVSSLAIASSVVDRASSLDSDVSQCTSIRTRSAPGCWSTYLVAIPANESA